MKKLYLILIPVVLAIVLFAGMVLGVIISGNTNIKTSPDASKTPQGQIVTVNLDLGNKTGNLTYIEEYYINDSAGNMTLNNRKIFFDGNVNASKIRLKILRPLNDGKIYPNSMVKAIAIVDNTTVLDAWYKNNN